MVRREWVGSGGWGGDDQPLLETSVVLDFSDHESYESKRVGNFSRFVFAACFCICWLVVLCLMRQL